MLDVASIESLVGLDRLLPMPSARPSARERSAIAAWFDEARRGINDDPGVVELRESMTALLDFTRRLIDAGRSLPTEAEIAKHLGWTIRGFYDAVAALNYASLPSLTGVRRGESTKDDRGGRP
jgi:hypothetical protein